MTWVMSSAKRFIRDELPLLAGFAGAAAVRSLISNAYEARRGDEPPTDPSQEGVDWGPAVTWTVVLAAGAAIGRLVATYAAGRATAKVMTQTQQK